MIEEKSAILSNLENSKDIFPLIVVPLKTFDFKNITFSNLTEPSIIELIILIEEPMQT